LQTGHSLDCIASSLKFAAQFGVKRSNVKHMEFFPVVRLQLAVQVRVDAVVLIYIARYWVHGYSSLCQIISTFVLYCCGESLTAVSEMRPFRMYLDCATRHANFHRRPAQTPTALGLRRHGVRCRG